MADRDDEFDSSLPSSTWSSDGTAPLDPNTDSAWMESEDPPPTVKPPLAPPPAAPPPDVPAAEPPVPVPPDAPVSKRSVAPPPDPPALEPSVAPPTDRPTVDWSAPPAAPWTGRRRPSRSPVAIIVALAAVAVLAALGGVVYAVGHSVRHRLAGPPPTRQCADPTYHVSTAATPAPRVTTPGRASGSTRTSHKRRLAFSLPSGWQSESSEGVFYGYEDRCGTPQISLSAVSTYGRGYCPAEHTAYRAIAGVRGAAGEHDLALAAGQAAEVWATWAYSGKRDEQPQVVVSRARPFTTHGTRGSLVRATARGTVPLECGAERGVVYAIAVDSADGADVFVISADQGASADPTEADLLAVAGSLHRVA